MAAPVPIPLDTGQADLDELVGHAPALVNMLVPGPPTGPRVVRARPGIRTWAAGPASFPSTSPVVAMVVIDGTDLAYVTDNGSGTRAVFTLRDATVTPCSSLADSYVAGALPVNLVAGKNMAIATGGGPPQMIAPGISVRVPGGPPASVDAAFIAQRLVVVQSGVDGLFFWCEPGDVTTWDLLLNFREAEARPDRLIGCRAGARELFMFGSGTTQVFFPEENETFAPRSALEVGALASRGAMRVGQLMYWLTELKEIVRSSGADHEAISGPIEETLDGLTAPTDVWCFRAKMGRHDLLTWVFPTDGRAFSFDAVSQVWSEWRRWADGRWQGWAPTSYVHWPERNVHLVGMPDGTIRELTLSSYRDMDDPIRWQVRTGFSQSAGQDHIVEARFPARRGEPSDETTSVAVSWRDDEGPFCTPVEARLVSGDPDATVSPAGAPHRRRQWQLVGTAPDVYLLAPGKALSEEAEF